MKRILVPIDFSAASNRILRQAAELARKFQAKVWLLHVAAPEPEFIGYKPGPPSVRDQVAARYRKEHRLLQRKAAQLNSKHIRTEALLLQGPTVDTILKESDRLKADLLILGSHGRSALARALLGSVSEGVLRHANCTVMIVKKAGGRR